MRWRDKIQNWIKWASQRKIYTFVLPLLLLTWLRSYNDHINISSTLFGCVPRSYSQVLCARWSGTLPDSAAAHLCQATVKRFRFKYISLIRRCSWLARFRKVWSNHLTIIGLSLNVVGIETCVTDDLVREATVVHSNSGAHLDRWSEAEGTVSTWAVSSLVRLLLIKDKCVIRITKHTNTYLMSLCWSKLFFLYNWCCGKSENANC